MRRTLAEDDRKQPRIVAALVASWEAKSRDLIVDGGGGEEEEEKKKKKASSSNEDFKDGDDRKASNIKTTFDVGLAWVKECSDNGKGWRPNGGG